MNEYIRPTPYPQRSAVAVPGTAKLAFLRKVYTLFTGSLVSASAGAMVALYAGADVSRVNIEVAGRAVTVPPLVAAGLAHPWISMFLFFGAFMGASAVRRQPGVNVAALFGATFISGLFLAPSLFLAQIAASTGHTLSASPVRDAFLLAVLGFTGISSYALLSKRDFSFLGGFLTMGLWVVLGASLLSFFVGGAAFSLAISSVGVLLFGGYILYDTSRMANDPEANHDPVGAALQLYLNFANLFIFLLRILSSSRRD